MAYHDEIDPQELHDLLLALALSETESTAPQRTLLPITRPESKAARGLLNFKKTWMYANSRLPPYMPPMTIYMPTWRLLCLAAQASLTVYDQPRGDEREHFVSANWQHSTKAMVVKTRPLDDQNLILFAIRGSQMNLADWSVNFRPAPVSATGFLDDAGNACHAGFLTVARAMVAPVAARLRQLLEQDPSRSSSSLLITGHSAGGAVAALLYAHMLSETVESELRDLVGCFKRVHCIIFGTPPLTLLPLQRPQSPRHKKSLFMSFINEGDPVVRAEKAYVRSLARVLATQAPTVPSVPSSLRRIKSRLLTTEPAVQVAPYWPVPPATLSNPGRLVVMRVKPGSDTVIEAVNTNDQQLRDVLFGDPSVHAMTLYKQRIDRLAVEAVTGNAPT